MRKSRALWGVLLIFIGLLWILRSVDLVNIDIWGSLRALWPVFIIAAGLTFFFRHESHVPRVVLWLLVFLLIGGYGIYLGYNDQGGTDLNKTFDMSGNIQSASLQVNVAGGRFDIGAGSQLADVHTNIKGIRFDYDGGSNPRIIYSQKNSFMGWDGRQSFNASLNDSIPWDIELNTGTANGTLDFKKVTIDRCTINTGSCDLNILAGSQSKDAHIVINAGAVGLKITLPENVGLKISSSSAVTNVNGSINMLKQGAVYLSDNFDNAETKLYMELSCGAGNITVNR